MNEKQVKYKLTILFTGSLLVILLIFIFILYSFITNAISKQEVEKLERFYVEENHEFIEDLFEIEFRPRRHIKFKPERDIFYYVFDKDFNMVEGEEVDSEFTDYINNYKMASQDSKVVKEVEWNKEHILFIQYPIEMNDNVIGSVIIGKEITDEKHLIQKIIWILILLAALFGVLFALVGNFFAGLAMKPIIKSYEKQKKFVSDASHELRTPLSVFYSLIDVLSIEEKENLSPFGKQVLEDAKHESEMMNKLLNDLLFLARSDQDKLELELEDLNVSDLLDTILDNFKRTLPDHLTLEDYIQEGLHIKGDKVRIQQLIYILLENAVRYTKEGSITCSLKSKGDKVEITVKDTGVGIAKEDIPHIFDRFYRGDVSRKRNGTGLGLSIAKVIAEAHHGEIKVNSELGKGTEFIIQLKLNPSA